MVAVAGRGRVILWRDGAGWWHHVKPGLAIATASGVPRRLPVSAGYPTVEDALACAREDDAP